MADRQMVSVDAAALRTILQALNGPAHHIREIQMTRSIAALTGDDPIGVLVEDFNRAIAGVTVAPKLCSYCGVVIDSGMACMTDGEFNHCPNKQIGEVISGVNASDCSRAAGHHFENGECVYCLDADPTYGVALPGPSLSMHPADKREMDRAFNEATDHSAQTLDMVAPGAGVPTLEPSAGAGSEPNSGTLVPAAGVKEVPRG
jgi:hypothetical protein